MKILLKLFALVSFIQSQSISIDPDSIFLEIFPGDSIEESFTIFNDGSDTLEVNIEAKDCADYSVTGLPYSHIGSTIGKQDDWFVNSGNSAGPDNAYYLNVNIPTTIDITLCFPETNYDAMLEIFTADYFCSATETGFFNDDDPLCIDYDTTNAGFPPSGIRGVNLTPGEYYIVVDGYPPSDTSPPGDGTYKISIEESENISSVITPQELFNEQVIYYQKAGKNPEYLQQIFPQNKGLAIQNHQNILSQVSDYVTISPVDTIVLPNSSQEISILLEVSENDSGGNYNFPITIFSNDSINQLVILNMDVDVMDIFPPSVPKNINATINNREIALEWSPSTGEPNQYNIYRGTDEEDTSLLDSVVGEPLQTFYPDFSIQSDQPYYYQISSVDRSGNESARSSNVFAIMKKSIIITELMINPNSTEDIQGEWFEILNNGTSVMNLWGWKLQSSGSQEFSFLEELVVYPNEYKVLGLNEDTLTNGSINISFNYTDLLLGDSNGFVKLVNQFGIVHDSVGWSLNEEYEGSSLSLIDINLDNSIDSHWVFSELPIGNGDFGSPGGPNFFSTILVFEDTLVFEPTAVGASSMRQVSVLNTGNIPLQIDTLVSNTEDFLTAYPDTSFMNYSMLDIQFSPSQPNELYGSITILSNSYENSEYTIHLVGIGYTDSLAPSVPLGFEGFLSDNIATLSWDESPEDDISYYMIDKSSTMEFLENQFTRFIIEGTSFSDTTNVEGETAFYRICAVDEVGNESDFSEVIQLINLYSDQKLLMPSRYQLHQNYPNPFNPVTNISYDLKDAGDVKIEIFNILGRQVRQYTFQNQAGGYYSLQWEGRDGENKNMSAGVYIYSLTVNNFKQYRKMVLLK